MNRQEYLRKVRQEVMATGTLSQETEDLRIDARVSIDTISKIEINSKVERSQIFEKHGVWKNLSESEGVRSKLKRALSCGDFLDEPENLERIKRLRELSEEFKILNERALKECQERGNNG